MVYSGALPRGEQQNHGSPGLSQRPALTHLVLLALTDRDMVERLMRGDPPEAALAHPHYRVVLDARDRATLDTIRDRATTVEPRAVAPLGPAKRQLHR